MPDIHRSIAPLLLIVLVLPALAGATADSDLLIVMDADGRYVAQHTLSSEGALVRLSLPEGIDPDIVRFAGPERATFEEAHRQSPRSVTLWSGSAVVRYRHRYGGALVEEDAGVYSLVVPSLPEGLAVEDGTLATSSITWLLPPGTELDGFTLADDAVDGAWSHTERTLTYLQQDSEIATLAIGWRMSDPTIVEAPCTDASDERCLPDRDADGIPDHRDVCLPALGTVDDADTNRGVRVDIDGDGVAGAGADVDLGLGLDLDLDAGAEKGDATIAVDPFGCPLAAALAQLPLRLDEVVFPSGQSYLELAARRQLDRVAEALLRDPTAIYEIAAHTDRAGRHTHNLSLSQRRARAARHYLMLRGVGPNQLHARGYGESRPLDDDTGPEAARINRRVELLRLD